MRTARTICIVGHRRGVVQFDFILTTCTQKIIILYAYTCTVLCIKKSLTTLFYIISSDAVSMLLSASILLIVVWLHLLPLSTSATCPPTDFCQHLSLHLSVSCYSMPLCSQLSSASSVWYVCQCCAEGNLSSNVGC